jgi:hypothetical protein
MVVRILYLNTGALHKAPHCLLREGPRSRENGRILRMGHVAGIGPSSGAQWRPLTAYLEPVVSCEKLLSSLVCIY